MEWGTEHGFLGKPNNRSTLRQQGLSLQNPETLLGEGNLVTEIREEKDPADQDGREVLENQASGRCWLWNREEIVLYSLPMGDKRHKAFLSGFGWPRAGPSLLDMTFKICFSLRKGMGRSVKNQPPRTKN